jgi:pimeloyl-ACP methyl ester carboxylesterase
MLVSLRAALLFATTLYQVVACVREDRSPPPGTLVKVEGQSFHLYTIGEGSPTVVLDHSLGGVEGYLLIEELAKLTRVCIYDRAGYGWSDSSPAPRTSAQIVAELDGLLTTAGIAPPYILIGDSFGSYNMRLYAYQYPQKVVGLILTDGLHEAGMLKMPFALKALKLFFVSGFLMSILGAGLGIIRLLTLVGCMELLKPALRHLPRHVLAPVKRSFCRPKHWLTMTREMLNLEVSGRQVSQAQSLGDLPIISIKAASFFTPSFWTAVIPLRSANQLRERMHQAIDTLSTNCQQHLAQKSSHFVWVDQPDVIINAVKMLLGLTVAVEASLEDAREETNS